MEIISIARYRTCLLIVPVIAGVACPAESFGDVLEEIIVVAQKREQPLQDVGISVTTFSGEQISALGMTESIDIVRHTPGLTVGTPAGEGQSPLFALRGVGLNDFNDNNESPVAVYVDEIYRSALPNLGLQLFDLERVEVLRGPQGTLYGRNTTGGLMHFITRKPAPDFEAYGDLTYGSYDQIRIEGALNVPLHEKAQMRLSVARNEHDGIVDNHFPGGADAQETDAYAGRAQFLFSFTDTLDLLLSLHGSDNEAAFPEMQHQAVALGGPDGVTTVELGPNDVNFTCPLVNPAFVFGPFAGAAAPGTDCLGYRDRDGDAHAGTYNTAGFIDIDDRGAAGTLTWRSGEFVVKSITAYDRYRRTGVRDADSGPFTAAITSLQSDIDQLSQEVQISGETAKLRWLAGLFYFKQDVDAGVDLDFTGMGFLDFDADYTQDTTSLAVFGQLEYDLSQAWTLQAGMRFTKEKRELDYANIEESGLLGALILGVPMPTMFIFNESTAPALAHNDNDSITAKIQLDWRPNENWLVYAMISRGTKSAGFNTGALDFTTDPGTVPFDEEVLTDYELGFKSTLLDGRARFNANVFYYDYRDFQALTFIRFNQFIFNTDAEIYGADFELAAKPWQGWEFLFGLSVLETEAKNINSRAIAPNPFFPGIPSIARKRDLVLAPELSLNGIARYEWPLWNGTMAVQADFNYQSETFFEIQNHPATRENGYLTGNMRLSYTGGDERWSVTVFVNNVTDQDYKLYTFDLADLMGANLVAYGRPRWFGTTISYRWH